jgi:hypothetical protein
VQVVRRFIPNTRTNIMPKKRNKVEEDNVHTSTQAQTRGEEADVKNRAMRPIMS